MFVALANGDISIYSRENSEFNVVKFKTIVHIIYKYIFVVFKRIFHGRNELYWSLNKKYILVFAVKIKSFQNLNIFILCVRYRHWNIPGLSVNSLAPVSVKLTLQPG